MEKLKNICKRVIFFKTRTVEQNRQNRSASSKLYVEEMNIEEEIKILNEHERGIVLFDDMLDHNKNKLTPSSQ